MIENLIEIADKVTLGGVKRLSLKYGYIEKLQREYNLADDAKIVDLLKLKDERSKSFFDNWDLVHIAYGLTVSMRTLISQMIGVVKDDACIYNAIHNIEMLPNGIKNSLVGRLKDKYHRRLAVRSVKGLSLKQRMRLSLAGTISYYLNGPLPI